MARGEPGRLLSTWQRWLVVAASRNLLYKGAAVFLALVLWLVVNAEEPTEDTVGVRLVLEHDDSLVLVGPRPMLRAAVVGRARDVTRLYRDSLEVRRSFPADAGDTVRFELTAADVLPPPGLDGEIRVRRVEPNVITLHLTTQVSRRVPVRSRVRVTIDSLWRQAGGPQLTPESVTVTGTRERVEAVVDVPTELVDHRIADTLGVMVALDTAGLGVQVSPSRLRLRVPVVRDTLYTLPTLPWGRPLVQPRRP